MTDVLTVGALGSVLLTRWKTIAMFVLMGLLGGVAYGLLAPASYTSKAVLFVIAAPSEKDGYYQATQFAEKRAATYPALLTAPEVLERTRAKLDLDMPASALIPLLTATNPTDSSLVEVAASAPAPQRAQQLAGSAAEFLADYAVELEANGTKAGSVTIKMAVPARTPKYPSSPSSLVLGALGGLSGAALGVITVLFLNAVRRRPRLGGGSTRQSAAGATLEGDPTGPKPSRDSSDTNEEGHPRTGRQRKHRRAHAAAGPVVADDIAQTVETAKGSPVVIADHNEARPLDRTRGTESNAVRSTARQPTFARGR